MISTNALWLIESFIDKYPIIFCVHTNKFHSLQIDYFLSIAVKFGVTISDDMCLSHTKHIGIGNRSNSHDNAKQIPNVT